MRTGSKTGSGAASCWTWMPPDGPAGIGSAVGTAIATRAGGGAGGGATASAPPDEPSPIHQSTLKPTTSTLRLPSTVHTQFGISAIPAAIPSHGEDRAP